MLDASGKSTTVEQNFEAIRILYRAEVKSYVSCMMGYLDETREEMLMTRDFILKAKPTGFQISLVVPFPGTQLWEDCKRLGLIDESRIDWLGMSATPTDRIPFKLSQLEIDELMALRRQFYRQIYCSSWLLYNAFRIRSLDDLKLGFGYLLSCLRRLRRNVTFSH